MSTQSRVAILGAGVMGETLLSAILGSGVPTERVVVSEKREERAAELRERHGVTVTDNVDAVRGADIVLVVVKPQDVPALLDEIAGVVADGATIVSLAAGIRIATYQAVLGDATGVIRAMPNTPALVGEGMFGVSPNDAVADDRLAEVVELLGSGGEVVVVPEAAQDAVTAVSGSGPAYVFYLAEAMIAAGVDLGLEPEVARTLATQTILGAARLLAESDDPADELRRRVTSPNGTTHAAITTFDDRGVRAGLEDGVRAAAVRSAELSGS